LAFKIKKKIMDEQQNIEFNSQIRKLQKEGIIKRIGPAKGGHWEVKE
jgi:predicted HTH transcriptional regulator